MSTSMWDQSSKLVPDQNISQVFEQALNVNDDYLRLLKISEGIKYITQKLPTATTFSSSKILFQLMCLYPFQKGNIEQLISAFFEYFQDFRFINSYYEAASNISTLSETTTQTLKQRITMMQRIPIKSINSSNEGQQFSQAVYQEVITIKLFSLKYLKKFFLLANEQQLDFQLYCFLFKHYIQNTTNQQIFEIIMDCFSELRFTIFAKCEWINQFSEEIIIYFKNTPKLFVSYTKYSNIVEMEEDSVEEIVSQTQIQVQQSVNKRKSYLTSDQDPSLYLQNLCCKQDIDQPLQHNSVFEEIDNVDILLQFIIDPNQIQVSHLWNESFPNIADVVDKEKNIFKLQSSTNLGKYSIYRSFKTLQILTNIENFKNLLGINAQIFAKIFYFFNLNFYDETKNINLHHAAILIKFVIYLQPKFCIKQIIEQKLFPKLLEFAYNPSINQLLQDIICFHDDTMKLGVYYLEQLWNYLYQIQFLKQLTQYVQNITEIIEIKTEQTPRNDVVQILKALSIFDQQKLQQRLLRQQTEDLSADMNSIQKKNDYDNLEQYEREQQASKQKNDKSFHRQSSIAQQLSDKKPHQIQKRASNNNFYLPKISSNADLDLKTFNNISTDQKGFNTKTSPIIRKRNQYSSHQIKNKLKTEYGNELYSNDGFSSSRLALIYPTTKSTIFLSDFEKERQAFTKIKISENHLLLLISLFNQVLEFGEQQEKLQKRLPKTQIFNLQKFSQELINENNLNLLFKIFLFYILELNQGPDSSMAEECGILLNKILIKSKTLNLLSDLNEIIKNQFQVSLDYLVKTIVQLNQLKSKFDSSSFAFKQYILVSVLINGYLLYDKQMYSIKVDKQFRSVFRNLTDTLLHIMIIWFSDSGQNNVYQLLFAQFMAIYFAGAPPPYLFNLIFKLGLVSSLYNAYSKFYQNEIKDTSYVEGIFFYTLIANFIIRCSIKYRNLIDLESTLGILDSWKQLESALPFDNKVAIGYFETIIKLEQPKVLEKTPNQKVDEKPNKFLKTKTQINSKMNSLVSFQKKTSEPDPKLNGMQTPKPQQSKRRLE